MTTSHIKFSLVALMVVALSSYSTDASAQYYYKDILSNQQLTKTVAQYKTNGVRKVSVKSIEADGKPSEGFFCEKKISKDYRNVELFTRSDLTSSSLFTSTFSEDGRLLATTDTSRISVTKIRYNYDDAKRIKSILSLMRSDDDDFRTEILEEHIYQYNTDGLPEKMFLVKNRKDTTLILFAADDDGNIITEMNTGNNSYYSYNYDEKKLLLSVAMSNDLRPHPVPEYIFRYNNQGLVSEMTATEEGMTDYTVWKYRYENGLPVSEKCYANGRNLIGSVEYEYK